MHPKPTMNLEEQSDVVLTFGQVLHVNGQSTDDTLAAAERLSNSLGLHATIIPSWGELQLEAHGRRHQIGLSGCRQSHRRAHGARRLCHESS